MRIRINIPAWGRREVVAGFGALARGGRTASRRTALREEVERLVPGWVALPVSSARYAIAIACRRLGLSGKRVAVPAYVCPAVLTGLRAAHAEPVIIDCAPSSVRFDPEALEAAISSGLADAVVAPNTYGVDQDFETLARLSVSVIEDAAYQSARTGQDGRLCGTRATSGVWSFNYKALTGVGGGILLTPEGESMEAPESAHAPRQFSLFVNYAVRSIARHRIPSFLPGAERPSARAHAPVREVLTRIDESSMSELQAAVILEQWARRHELETIQRRNVHTLGRAVTDTGVLAPLAGETDSVVHLYPCLARSRAEAAAVRIGLYHRGIQTEDPYPLAGDASARFENATDLAERLVLVPCNASLHEAQIEYVASALAAVCAEIQERQAVCATSTT